MAWDNIYNQCNVIWLNNGIVHVIEICDILDLEQAKLNVAYRLEVTAGKTYPMFVDARVIKSVEKPARAYLTQGDSIRGISAGAFLVKNWAQEVIANFILNIRNPPIPCKLFRDQEKALEWLDQFKRIN